MTIQSKLSPIRITCEEYVHPWTDSCSIATAGLILQAAQDSFRIYSAVYTLSLLMRCRMPTLKDLKRTAIGIIQSTAFLTTHSFLYCLFLCIIRNTVGSFNFFTFSYVPAFLSSICALLLERPSRRGLLCLYVSNVATETLFNMAASRNYVKRIKYGQVMIFGASAALMLYYFRKGIHHNQKDSMFDILRFVIGNSEEKSLNERSVAPTSQQTMVQQQQQRSRIVLSHRTKTHIKLMWQAIQIYTQLIQRIKRMAKHKTCPHSNSCTYYVMQGGMKLFSIGLGVQISLKIIFQIKRLLRHGPLYLRKILFTKDTLKLGVFLGGFSLLFRMCSCLLRHSTGMDDPLYAIPAALVASIAFISYPDTTVALYVMWKMLQITYNIGVDKGFLPNIPHFAFILYCANTATLFHAATMEPLNLRQSYWTFLHSLSGGRVAGMARKPLDIYGLETSKQLMEMLRRTKTTNEIKFTL